MTTEERVNEIVAPLLLRCRTGHAALVLVLFQGDEPPVSTQRAVAAALRTQGLRTEALRLGELRPDPVAALVLLARRGGDRPVFSIDCPVDALMDGELVTALNIHRNTFAREQLCIVLWVPVAGMPLLAERAANFLDFRTRTVDLDAPQLGLNVAQSAASVVAATPATKQHYETTNWQPLFRSTIHYEMMAFTQDGTRFALQAPKGGIEIRDGSSGELKREMILPFPGVLRRMSWAPNGAALALLFQGDNTSIWLLTGGDLFTAKTIHLESYNALSRLFRSNFFVQWLTGPPRLAIIGEGSSWFWYQTSQHKQHGEKHLLGDIFLYSNDGNNLAILFGTKLSITHISNNKSQTKILAWSPGNYDTSINPDKLIQALAFSPNGSWLIAVGRRVFVFDTERSSLRFTLECPASDLIDVGFSADGRQLIALSESRGIFCWEVERWRPLEVERPAEIRRWHGMEILGANSQVAALTSSSRGSEIWTLDLRIRAIPAPAPLPAYDAYSNAKVVLLGDSGVGKSGLALRLMGEVFRPTESSHGRRVYTFDRAEVTLSNGDREQREILLWDLAGQPGYRMIHQLHLQQAVVAVVLFDARSDTDPFAGVRHWDRALRLAQRLHGGAPIHKLLVAARVDRGGVPLSRGRVLKFAREHDFDAYLETSAKTGEGIAELAALLRRSIPWDDLPRTRSPEVLTNIKAFLLAEKDAGRLLSERRALFLRYLQGRGDAPTPPDFEDTFATAVHLLEAQDMLRALSFGDLVLLQPEYLDGYASALVHAAREEPDGLGCIAQDDALAGRFRLPLDERVNDSAAERLLLIATLEELLRHEIALRETSEGAVQLVFPAQLVRERPDLPDPEGKAVVFSFEGPVLSIYATLAVRLSRSGVFRKQALWKNAATFIADGGSVCGMFLRERDEAQGELTLFFEGAASAEARQHFEEYVRVHLLQRALPGTLTRRRIFSCASCGTPVADVVVRRRRERGVSTLACPVCEAPISILESAASLDAPPLPIVPQMVRTADEGRDKEVAAAVALGEQAAKELGGRVVAGPNKARDDLPVVS